MQTLNNSKGWFVDHQPIVKKNVTKLMFSRTIGGAVKRHGEHSPVI